MNEEKEYGVRVRMPTNDPLAQSHLLGDSWSSERWYSTARERDQAFDKMEQQPPYYRKGDSPSVLLEKIER